MQAQNLNEIFENVNTNMNFKISKNQISVSTTKNNIRNAKKFVFNIYLDYINFLFSEINNKDRAIELLNNYDKFINLIDEKEKNYYFRKIAEICRTMKLDEKRDFFINKTLTDKEIYNKKLTECKEFENSREYKKAIDCYTTILSDEPKNKNIQNRLIQNVRKYGTQKGNTESAVSILDKIISETGDVDFKVKSYNLIIRLCDQFRRNNPNNNLYFDLTENCYKKIIEISPDVLNAKFNLAGYYFRERMYDNSKKHLSELVDQIVDNELDISKLNIVYKSVEMLMGLEQYEDVIKLQNKIDNLVEDLEKNDLNILKEHNKSNKLSNLRIQYCNALYETGQIKKARKQAKLVYKLIKKEKIAQPSIYHMESLGDLLVKLNKYKLAEKQYLSILDKNERKSTYEKIISLYKDNLKNERKAQDFETRYKNYLRNNLKR